MTDEQRQTIRSTNYYPLASKAYSDLAFHRLLSDSPDCAIEQYFGVPITDMDEETAGIARNAVRLALIRLSHR